MMQESMGAESEDGAAKAKHQDNPFIEPAQNQTVVDMKGQYNHKLQINPDKNNISIWSK
jgi:hypothetical protein